MKLRWMLLQLAVLFCAQVQAQSIAGQYRYGTAGPLEVTSYTSTRDSAGNYYAVGESGIYAPYDIGQCVVQKFNSAGTLQWTSLYSVPPNSEVFPAAIWANAGGQVLLVGAFQDQVTLKTSLFMRFFSPTGAVLWTLTDPGVSQLQGVAFDSTGNPILAESTSAGLSLVKYSAATHAVLWNKVQSFGTSPSVAFMANDGAGHVYEMVNEGTAGFVLARINATSGAIVWSKPYTSPTNAVFNPSGGTVLASGDLAVFGTGYDSGYTYSAATMDRVTAATGNVAYRKVFGTQVKGDFTTFLGKPVTDGANQLYWAVRDNDTGTSKVASSIGKTSATGAQVFAKALATSYTDVLITPGTTGGMFAAATNGTAARTLLAFSSTGASIWTAVVAPQLSPKGGALMVDASNNVTYANYGVDSLFERRIELIKLNGATHAQIFDVRPTTNGIMDSSFSCVAGHDATGNSYVVGKENFTCFVSKISPTGTVLWKTYVGATLPAFQGSQLASADFSPTHGVAFLGYSSNLAEVALVSTAGALVWAKTFALSNSSVYPNALEFAPNGNLDIGSQDFSATSKVEIDQVSGTTGALLWRCSTPALGANGHIVVDSAGAVYTAGAPPADTGWLLVKVSSTGVRQFAKTISVGTTAFYYPGIAYDAASGNILLGAGNSVPDGSAFGAGTLQVGRFDSNGNTIWISPITVSGFYAPGAVQLASAGPAGIYAEYQAQSQTGNEGTSTFVTKLNPGGAKIWTNTYSPAGSTNQYNTMAIDLYGNVVIAGQAGGAYLAQQQVFAEKLDRNDGSIRYRGTALGTYTTLFSSINGLTIGSDNKPLLFGATPAATGPGSHNAWMTKLATPPFCVADSFSLKENGILANISVAINDEDPTGATYSVVKAPTHAASYSLSTTGLLNYKPAANFTGTDSFTYNAKNTYGTSRTVTVTLTVTP